MPEEEFGILEQASESLIQQAFHDAEALLTLRQIRGKLGPWFVSTLSWLALIYSILAVELTIKWNGISDVYEVRSAGQLIPLVIGVAGLLKTGSDIREKYAVGA
jgi:uncharacterized membrane protein